MSHVDDGTLHALVDNELDAAERAQVEAHLASCGDCARRFAEATAMARQVHTLLAALDAPAGAVRVERPAPSGAVKRETTVATPIASRRAPLVTLRRIALAASVLLVAGVSYQLGTRHEPAPAAASLDRAAGAAPNAAPVVSTPSVVEAAPEAVANTLAAAPAARPRTRGGPRTDSEVIAERNDGYAGARAASPAQNAPAAPPAAQSLSQAVAIPLPTVVASDVSQDSATSRRTAAETAAVALGRVQAEEQARAQKGAAASDRMSKLRDAPLRLESVVVTGVSSAPAAAAGSTAPTAKPTASKLVPLAGYTATEEESVPAITRRRYVSSAGTPLTLLIVQPVNDAKKSSRAEAATSEFVVTTANGRSTVRWHARGLDYELQGALAPDSLVKLATQLK
jgi:anti-sigma factor RsiW